MKRKKVTRQRGSKTHGWGAMKKHRGAGNRGGRGNAGSGKRGDQKKPSYWNAKARGEKKPYFGKYGFNSIHATEVKTINVQELSARVVVWASEKKVTKTGDKYTVDLKALGYGKLLGTGKATAKLAVTVDQASEKAVEKINAAGGSVTVLAGGSDAEE